MKNCCRKTGRWNAMRSGFRKITEQNPAGGLSSDSHQNPETAISADYTYGTKKEQAVLQPVFLFSETVNCIFGRPAGF